MDGFLLAQMMTLTVVVVCGTGIVVSRLTRIAGVLEQIEKYLQNRSGLKDPLSNG